MLQNISFPLYGEVFQEYTDWDDLRREVAALGCDGLEGIWGGEPFPEDFPSDLIQGYHLTFYPDWLDFYREDNEALRRKFGSLDAAYSFYGGRGPQHLLELYRDDLDRARALGARYVVFHVSDVSIEEGYTYQWLHSDEDVLDASAEVINELLRDVSPDFDFLVENQWWPGFTFTEPDKTARLLDHIRYPRTGILLDTGHLMNTNPSIRTQAEGIAYIHRQLQMHGELSRRILGVHWHQSVSGAYVRTHTGFLPEDLPADPMQRFAFSYAHILQIDRHRPWTNPAAADLLDEIAPRYLTHELSAAGRQARKRAVRRQIHTIQKGRDLHAE